MNTPANRIARLEQVLGFFRAGRMSYESADVTVEGIDARGDHVIILRFDGAESLHRWEASPERTRWLAEANDFTEHLASIQRISGLEGLFTPPRTRVSLAPPKWKMFLVVSLGLYPLVALTAVFIAPMLGAVPLLPRLVVTTLLNVALMTWVVMPLLTWALRAWLTPPA